MKEPGITLLGDLLGTPQLVKEAFKLKMDTVLEVINLLPIIKDPPHGVVALHSCLALSKILFSFRTVDTNHHQPPGPLQEYFCV